MPDALEQDDYQDQIEQQRAGITSTTSPAALYQRSPDVYSPYPAPPTAPSRPLHRPPPPTGSGDYELTGRDFGMPEPKPEPQSEGWGKYWGDIGRSMWASTAGMGADLVGAAQYATQQLNASPEVQDYLKDKRSQIEQHVRGVLNDMSPEHREAMEASIFKGGATDDQGNIIPHVTGQNFTNYLAFNAAGLVPSVLATLLPAGMVGRLAVAGARTLGAGAKVAEGASAAGQALGAGGFWGTANAGNVYNQIHDQIGNAKDADLIAGSAPYAELRSQGKSEAEAKEALTGTVARYLVGAAAGVGAVAGAGVGGLLTRGAMGAAGRGVLGRAAIGGAEGGAAMGAQGGANEALTQGAQIQTGQRQNLDYNQILAEAASQGLPGLAMGAVGGALHGRKGIEETSPPPKGANPDVPPDQAAALTEALQPPPDPVRKTLTSQPAGFGAPGVGDQGEMFQPFEMSQNAPQPSAGIPTGATQGEMFPQPGAGTTQGQTEAFPPPAMGPPRVSPGAGLPAEAAQGEMFAPEPGATPPTAPTATTAPAPQPAPPGMEAAATQALTARPRGPAAPAADSPSKGMNLKALKEALTTMPGIDPRQLKGLALPRARELYDRHSASEPSTTEPTVPTQTTTSEPATVGEETPVSGSTPDTASPAPGGGLLTPRPAPERGARQANFVQEEPRVATAEEAAAKPAEQLATGESVQAKAPAVDAPVPKKPATPAERRAAAKAKMAARMGAGTEVAPTGPKPYVAEEERTSAPLVETGSQAAAEQGRVEQRRADRTTDLRDAMAKVIPVRAGQDISPILRNAVRNMVEGIHKTDGSDDAIHELLDAFGDQNPTQRIPGTSTTRRGLADDLIRLVTKREPKRQVEARDIAAAHSGDVGERTAGGGKQVAGKTGEDIVAEHGRAEPEGEEGSAGLTQELTTVASKSVAQSVTDNKRKAANLMRRVLDDEMSVHDAAREFDKVETGEGKGEDKGGRDRAKGFENFENVLKGELAHITNEDNLRAAINRSIEFETKKADMTPQERGNRGRHLQADINRFDPDRIQRLQDKLHELIDPVGHAVEDAPGHHPTSDGIDPRSSRYVKIAQDPRVDADYLRALRASEQHRVPFTVHDFLRNILQNSLIRTELKPFRLLAAQLLRRARDIPIKTLDLARFDDDINDAQHADMVQRQVYGRYTPDLDNIIVNPDAQRVTGTHTETALHEIMHSITHDYIRNLQKTDRNHPDLLALQAMRRELADHMDAAHKAGDLSDAELRRVGYAVSSVHELHTQMMTDPIVQAFAASRTASPEFRATLAKYGFAPREQGRSVWRYFTDWMRRALGLRAPASASEYTLLDHLLRPMTDITEHATAYNKGDLPKDGVLRSRAEPMYDAVTGAAPGRAGELAGRVLDHVDLAGKGDRVRRALLAAMPSDAIVSRYRGILPSLTAWRGANESIARTAKVFSDTNADKVSSWTQRYRQLKDAPALGKLMTDVGVHDVKVGSNLAADANEHLTTPEQLAAARGLQERYNKLSAPARALYDEARDTYNDWYKQRRIAELASLVRGFMPEATEDQVKAFTKAVGGKKSLEAFLADSDNSATAQAFGADWAKNRAVARGIARVHSYGFVQGDYFPLRRFGDYVVRYGYREDPENYGVERFESRRKAEARYAELKAQKTEGLKPVSLLAESHLRDLAPHSAAVGELTDALAKRGFDEARRKEVEDTLNGILLQHASRSEAARSRMRREGVRGASEDHSRVLANEFLSNQMRLGYLEHGLSLAQALESMRREVDEHEHPNAAPGAAIAARSVLSEAQKRTMPVEAHDSAFQRLGAKANSFSYAQSLMSFSHMLTSSMEAHTNSVALLSARHGPIKASLRLTRALVGAAPVLKEGAVNTFKAVGGQLKAADWNLSHVIRDRYLAQKGADRAGIIQLFKELEDAGLIDHTVLQDLRRQANPSGRIGSAAGDVWQRFTNFMAAGGHAVDVMNKAAIAKAAYDLEFAKTHDRSKSVEYAIETARRVMPNYNLGNKARIATNRGPLGAVGSPLFQFKNYGLHMYSLLANLARDSMGGPNAKEARYAFANLLATHAMMAGVLTLIADPLRYVMGAYDFATGAQRPHDYQNDVRQGIASIFGPEIGELISRGLPHALGIDLHRRVGLANLLEVPEMSTFDKKGAEDVLVGLATGATGENLTAIVDGLNKTLKGDPTSGIKALLPRPARDVMKAIDYGTRGVLDSQGKPILPPEKLSTGDLVAQGLGFQPARVSEFREGRNAVLEAREEAQAEHTRLVNRWLAADAGERQNVMQEIRLFNQDPHNLGFRITQGQLLRDAQARRKQAGAPFGLRLPRKGAAQLAEAGAFANVQ